MSIRAKIAKYWDERNQLDEQLRQDVNSHMENLKKLGIQVDTEQAQVRIYMPGVGGYGVEISDHLERDEIAELLQIFSSSEDEDQFIEKVEDMELSGLREEFGVVTESEIYEMTKAFKESGLSPEEIYESIGSVSGIPENMADELFDH